MKIEYKIIIIDFFPLLVFMFADGCSLGQKIPYIHQNFVYKEGDDKNKIIKELNKTDSDNYFYSRNNQYDVIFINSDKQENIEKHMDNFKRTTKSYTATLSTTNETLLNGEII